MSCCLISPPSGAAQSSVRLLGSHFTPQETSVGACGCHPGSWHLPPPVLRWSLRTPLRVPAALFLGPSSRRASPGCSFFFYLTPVPLWTSSHGWSLSPVSLLALESSFTALGAASFLFRLDSAAAVTLPGSHHFRLATAWNFSRNPYLSASESITHGGIFLAFLTPQDNGLPFHFPSLHFFLPVPTLFSFFLAVLLFLESGHTYKTQRV